MSSISRGRSATSGSPRALSITRVFPFLLCTYIKELYYPCCYAKNFPIFTFFVILIIAFKMMILAHLLYCLQRDSLGYIADVSLSRRRHRHAECTLDVASSPRGATRSYGSREGGVVAPGRKVPGQPVGRQDNPHLADF